MVDEASPKGLRLRRHNIADAVCWLQEEVENKIINEANLDFVVREEQIRSLHSICMDGLLENAGSYRTTDVRISGNHQPPLAVCVRSLMGEFVAAINDKIDSGDNHIDVSAFALWRMNWIHPFSNGNGRTSRLFAYFVMCMCANSLFVGKGRELVPDQLDGSLHGDYLKALEKADEAFAKTGQEDLLPLQKLLAIAVTKQVVG